MASILDKASLRPSRNTRFVNVENSTPVSANYQTQAMPSTHNKKSDTPEVKPNVIQTFPGRRILPIRKSSRSGIPPKAIRAPSPDSSDETMSSSEDYSDSEIDSEELVPLQLSSSIGHRKPPTIVSSRKVTKGALIVDASTQVSSHSISKKTPTQIKLEEVKEYRVHLNYLLKPSQLQDEQEVEVAPLFTKMVQKHHAQAFKQYGFFAGISSLLEEVPTSSPPSIELDPRLFFNVSAPSSAFICGSQGSGKSHSLSCLLENCLASSSVSYVQKPLSALLFHHDPFISDLEGTPCEAAYLSSNPDIKVRVLCAPTNFATIKYTYQHLTNVTVEELRIDQASLNTQRMYDLMAVNMTRGRLPLYLYSIDRILRDMRIEQQKNHGTSFNYRHFKQLIDGLTLTREQLAPLTQRLELLESFMPKSQTTTLASQKVKDKGMNGNDWTVKPGQLTIIDLSCPCVTADAARDLFNMCLSMFLEQKTDVGRVVALDEAHKYMTDATDGSSLTQTLIQTIRLQRHLGTRIFISTQEPTISCTLLDICSITIVHRFTSPAWLQTLKGHLAALDKSQLDDQGADDVQNIFTEIVRLRVGEALCFAPSAITSMEKILGTTEMKTKRLGNGYLKIKVRERITRDGGKSIMA